VADGTAAGADGTAAAVGGMARVRGTARECGAAPLGAVQRGTAASLPIVGSLSSIAIALLDRSSGFMPPATRRVGAGLRLPSVGDGFGSVTIHTDTSEDPQSPACERRVNARYGPG
jgi:hypothetical protein